MPKPVITERPLLARHFSPRTLAAKDLNGILKQCGCRPGTLTTSLQEVFRRYGFTTVLTDPAASQYLVEHAGVLIENQAKGISLIPNLKAVFANQQVMVLQHKSDPRKISLILASANRVKAAEELLKNFLKPTPPTDSAPEQAKTSTLEVLDAILDFFTFI